MRANNKLKEVIQGNYVLLNVGFIQKE